MGPPTSFKEKWTNSRHLRMAAQALFLRVRDRGGCADANDDQDARPVLTTPHLGLRGLRDTVAFDSLLEQDRTKDGRKHGADGREVGIRVQMRQLVQQYGEDLVRHAEHHEGCRGDHLADIQLEVRDGKPAPAREDDRRTHQDRPLHQNRRHGTGVAGISELQQCGKELARDHCAHIVVEHETPRRKLGLRDQVLDQDAVQGHEREVKRHPSGGVHQQALVRRGISDGAEQNDAEASSKAHGMGTTERMTMNVSTLEEETTALPTVMVMKNMPAAGKNLINLLMSSASTSMSPSLPARYVTTAAKRNCSVVSVQTKGNSFSAHLLMTSKQEAQRAWPSTKCRACDCDTSGFGGAASLANPASIAAAINAADEPRFSTAILGVPLHMAAVSSGASRATVMHTRRPQNGRPSEST
mmetsp:Transcript_52071/g.169118  ORF Transcript_52071/g.169118 Transcript_52071/m.169118 type:complete len:413 (-) Transcript_52071:25-1263(-)